MNAEGTKFSSRPDGPQYLPPELSKGLNQSRDGGLINYCFFLHRRMLEI
jgi:hypothetical protein